MQFGTAKVFLKVNCQGLFYFSEVSVCCLCIHTVALCLGSVQPLFMCLEIWLPTLLVVQLHVFYVFASAGG